MSKKSSRRRRYRSRWRRDRSQLHRLRAVACEVVKRPSSPAKSCAKVGRPPFRGYHSRAGLVRAPVAKIVLTQIGRATPQGKFAMHIIWTIIIGFIAGVIAKFVTPGDNEPSGFILTTILGIVGAFLATYLGQAIGWYRADEGAGLIGAVVGAIIILVIWGFIDRQRRPSP